MVEETPASSGETDEKEAAAERRRERRRIVLQLLLDWSPVLAKLTKVVMQHLS